MEMQLEVRIEGLLIRAARHRRIVSYGDFHALFPHDIPLVKRYAMLEKTAATICEPHTADYASLLATACGLPGPDFYKRFRRLHTDRYNDVVGIDRNRLLKLVEKQRFAREERDRVYHDARERFGVTEAGVIRGGFDRFGMVGNEVAARAVVALESKVG